MEGYYLGNGRKWIFGGTYLDKRVTDDSNPDIPEIIRIILEQRGIKSQDDVLKFLNPDLNSLCDPFLFEDMGKSVDRILAAISNNEKILVYGDYDVDGVTATAILVSFLRSQGAIVDFYIPDRIEEGYGISDSAVEYISNNNYDLMITVDCGITSRFQIEAIYELCAQKGRSIDVIVTDHHQYNGGLVPEVLAILNPHIPSCNYPFKNLCGAGIALKLIQAIGSKLGISNAYKEYLDMAALGTIADIVELKGENRIIARFGIEKMVKNPCLGIRALIKAASLQKKLDSLYVSFGLAPRINAAGRMGDAGCAVNMFLTRDEAEADKAALLLNKANISRQEIQDEIFKAALKKIDDDKTYMDEKILVVYGEGWHHGVIGIVASKLVDRFHKPTFVISIDNHSAVGSGRSIEGFNLFNAMESQSDILTRFGGHEQAGGITLKAQDVEFFRKRINIYADDLINEEMLLPVTTIHLDVSGMSLDIKTAKMLSKLEPYGAGNQVPVFCFKGAIIKDKKTVGDGKHLRLVLDINGSRIAGIYFNKGYLEQGIFIGDKVDVVFTLEINTWKNNEYLQIRLYDLRLNEQELVRNRFLCEAASKVECLDCDENWLYNGIIDKKIGFDDIVVNRDILAVIYRYITGKGLKTISVKDVFIHSKILENETKKKINYFKFYIALLIFEELDLINMELGENGTYCITRCTEAKKVKLEDSSILDWLYATSNSMCETR